MSSQQGNLEVGTHAVCESGDPGPGRVGTPMPPPAPQEPTLLTPELGPPLGGAIPLALPGPQANTGVLGQDWVQAQNGCFSPDISEPFYFTLFRNLSF